MSIVKSNDNFDRLEPYKDMIKQKINFILKNYPQCTIKEQHYLFLDICKGIDVSIQEFVQYRNEVKAQMKFNYINDDTDLQYHLEYGMTNSHMYIFNVLQKHLYRYQQMWNQESEQSDPDTDKLMDLSKIIIELSNMVSKYILGTPVLYFVKYGNQAKQNNQQGLSLKTILDINKYTQSDIDNNTSNGSEPNIRNENQESNRSADFSLGLNNKEHVRERQAALSGAIREAQETKSRREKEEIF